MKKRALCLTRSAGIGIVFLITASLLLGGPASADAAATPTIVSFTVTAVTEGDKGAEGNWVELSWKTEPADRVRLLRDRQEIRGRHQLPNGEIGWPVSMDAGLKTRLKSRAVFKLLAYCQNIDWGSVIMQMLEDIPNPAVPDDVEVFRVDHLSNVKK